MVRIHCATLWRLSHGGTICASAKCPAHLSWSASPRARVKCYSDMASSHDPHNYTSGRWLCDDAVRRQTRFIDFDFRLLCDRAVKLSPGATAIRSWHKKEGGFNRVFIMELDTGARLVARIPYPGVGLPQRIATASEVATIAYLQKHTSVPIPRVMEWNSDPQNPVGCEYIIMQEARGVLLSEQWPHMTTPQRVSCIESIFQNMKQLHNLEFSGYGCIYNDVDSLLPGSTTFELKSGFCLSEHCGNRYWDSGAAECKSLHRGPWRDLQGFADSLVDVGIARIPTASYHTPGAPSYQGSPEEHITLLAAGRHVLHQMSASSTIQNAATPLLYHPDLHARNIFVSKHDPTVVTDIIDWQGTSVEPAFWYADETPDFASSDDEICAKAFAACSAFLLPRLALPQRMDENLFRPYRYCYRTWKDGIAAYRHELAETVAHWDDLGLQSPRPEIDENVIQEDKKAYDLFVTAQTLKKDLAGLLDCDTDGWVEAGSYQATREAHYEIFRGMLKAVVEEDDDNDDASSSETVKDEKTLRAIWPFDLDG